jgi:thiamine kinase
MPELEALMAEVLPGTGAVTLQPLRAGLVNRTFRVGRGGACYALRVDAPDAAELGFDRRFETRILATAAAAGLAPPTVYADAERGLWVTRWVDGRTWAAADAAQPQAMHRIVALMRSVHALPIPAPARCMSAWDWVNYYQAARPAHADLQARAAHCWQRLPAFGIEPALCHSDLHVLNLIDQGTALLLLDWEYAHVADPLWDLAGWSANNDYPQALRAALLGLYLARAPRAEESLRLELLTWLYDYVCLLWSGVYLSRGAAGDGAIAARAGQLAARLADAAL